MSNLSECYSSNYNNPMMNFIPFDKMDRAPACEPTITEKIEEINYYNTNHTTLLEELTGIPRIYTMPVTTSTQDLVGFAKSLYPDTAFMRSTGYGTDYIGFANAIYPDTAICRKNGYICKSNADNTFSLDRLSYDMNQQFAVIGYNMDTPYYQKINTSKMPCWDTPLYDIQNDKI